MSVALRQRWLRVLGRAARLPQPPIRRRCRCGGVHSDWEFHTPEACARSKSGLEAARKRSRRAPWNSRDGRLEEPLDVEVGQ